MIGGAPWSCWHIRLLMVPRDRGSNPRGGKKKYYLVFFHSLLNLELQGGLNNHLINTVKGVRVHHILEGPPGENP